MAEMRMGRGSGWWKRNGRGYLFMLPFTVLFIMFTVIPAAVAFITSFTSYNMLEPMRFTGVSNYFLLFMDDDIFIMAFKNTMIFALITGPIGFFMSLLVAWVINSLKFRNLFSLAFYIPSIASVVAMSVIWLYFFSSDSYGFINHLLLNLGIISEPVLWLSNPKTIMPVIMFVHVWMSMGTGFLVFLAGLQNIPRTYYEAARIDGVKNQVSEFFYITLPVLKPQMLFGAINAVVASFGVFDIAVAMAGMPSPNYAAHTIVAHLYDYAFIRFQMGYASAVAIILFLLSFGAGQILLRVLNDRD